MNDLAQSGTPIAARLRRSIDAFIAWLDTQGLHSHDPYDIWGTQYGVFSRRIYYAHGRLGLPLVAPLIAAELVAPAAVRTLITKQRYATAEAQLILGFLSLYRSTGDARHLSRAESLANGLLTLSIPGYSGHCWGYPFDWQNQSGLWKRNTPFITATPYCYEAFSRLADVTNSAEHRAVSLSIARFVATDLHDTPTSETGAAASYSPIDHGKVINASAYRAFVLFDAWRRHGDDAFKAIATRNLAFVLETQRPDGSWLYALDSPGEAFIDHFHTCFVLKNLEKIEGIEDTTAVSDAISRGWHFYRQHLFHADGHPKSFSIEPRTQLARTELYNFAEAISLGVLLRSRFTDALPLAVRLGLEAADTYQLRDGHFVTRVYRNGRRHLLPFLRWPQAQMFLALTSLLECHALTSSVHLEALSDRLTARTPSPAPA